MVGDQVRDFSAAIAKACEAARAPSTQTRLDVDAFGLPKKREILIDLDGFFRPLVEMGDLTYQELVAALPGTGSQTRRALVLHSLFRSSLVLTNRNPREIDKTILSVWSQLSLFFGIVGASRGFLPEAPEWLTFYSDDLHRHFSKTLDAARGSRLELTLDQRLVAFTDVKRGTVQVSAITREYLLRINVYLANLAEAVVERGVVVNKEDSRKFFLYVLDYVLRLHRVLHPSHIPVARPETCDTFSFAQGITQIQIEFLMSHEFGHLVLPFQSDTGRVEQELACDSFAFERVAEFNHKPWMRFLAVRWLFELLAFDRVLAKCLGFRDGDWIRDVDWLQENFRKRRRVEVLLAEEKGGGKSLLSAYENIGALFLIDLKGNLCEMGPESLGRYVDSIAIREATPPCSWLSAHVNGIAERAFEDGPISARRVLEACRGS